MNQQVSVPITIQPVAPQISPLSACQSLARTIAALVPVPLACCSDTVSRLSLENRLAALHDANLGITVPNYFVCHFNQAPHFAATESEHLARIAEIAAHLANKNHF